MRNFLSLEQGNGIVSQAAAMEQFCLGRGPAVGGWVGDVRGGMSPRRGEFLAVMDAVERGEVATLMVAHRDWLGDRPARFGFDFLEHVATRHGCEILVADQEALTGGGR